MITICMSAMNDCIWLIARREHHAEGRDREGEQQLQREQLEDQAEA